MPENTQRTNREKEEEKLYKEIIRDNKKYVGKPRKKISDMSPRELQCSLLVENRIRCEECLEMATQITHASEDGKGYCDKHFTH